MENYKKLTEITQIDERHQLLGQLTGRVLNLEKMHAVVGDIELHPGVPERIRSQFNVARNMALYTYFCYSFAPEVHMKSYSVMEMALREYFEGDTKTNLKHLVRRVVESGVVCDKGFRHVPDDPENAYCQRFIEKFPNLRNISAHGTSMLDPNCVGHLEICADFINQLFPRG